MEANLCLNCTKSDWRQLDARLDADDAPDWISAVAVFESRIKERFLACIDALIAADTKPDLGLPRCSGHAPAHCIPGFSIMALCCLLIDTIQGFREPPAVLADPAGPCPYPAGDCIKPRATTNDQFKRFLRRPAFGNAFLDDKVARSFVNGVRNGILHEAETRKWVIWREEPHGEIVAPEQDGYALNRNLFYAALKSECESYFEELRSPSNRQLRQRFRKKMKDICREA